MGSRALVFSLIFIVISIHMFRMKSPVFMKCIYTGIACYFLCIMWEFCNSLWRSEPESFYMIETFSKVSALLFWFTASFGALDSLVDDGSKEMRKYMYFSLAVMTPYTIAWIVGMIWFRNIHFLFLGASISAVVMISFKHLIIPDIPDGFVQTLRCYNLVLLVEALFQMIYLFMLGIGDLGAVEIVVRSFCDLGVLLLYPAAYMGVKKWSLV